SQLEEYHKEQPHVTWIKVVDTEANKIAAEIIEAHLRQENSMDPEFQANQQSNQITDWAMRPKEALLLHHNQYGK
ncbi:hypothetical protein KXV92_005720, partial [Aspergillus fumigatus]